MTNVGNNLVLVSKRVSRSTTGGYQTVTEYEGTKLAIDGFAMTLGTDASWSIDDSERPKAKLTISVPYLDSGNATPEAPTNTWELPGNALQKDVYEHANTLALGQNLIAIIKAGVRDIEASSVETALETLVAVVAQIDGETADPVIRAAAKLLVDLLLKGTNQFQTTQYVLRHTRTVGARTDTQVAFSNVEKIYTAAQIQAEDPIPSTLVFSIGNIPAPSNKTGYTWGWLKQTPSVRQVAAGKFEIVNEWWLEQWSNFLYATVT